MVDESRDVQRQEETTEPRRSLAPKLDNPFGSIGSVQSASQQAVALKEMAQLQILIGMAKRNPRDPIMAMDRILNDCTRPSFAEDATYVYARGGTEITGPSIRLAEGIARGWGNISAGVIELSRTNDVSECQTYALDLETLFFDEKRFQVRHWRDTRQGGYKLTDERDIYELIANMGARRKRACILAVIPGDVIERAINQCDVTLKTHVDVTAETINKMVESFEKFSVTRAMIEKKIQRRIDTILPAQVMQLKKIYASLRDGMATAPDFFEAADVSQIKQQPSKGPASGASGLKEAVQQKQEAKPTEGKPKELTKDDLTAAQIGFIQELRTCISVAEVDVEWKDIAVFYDRHKIPIPIDIEAVRNEIREGLEEAAKQ
jgi:hypothetical protein